MLTPLFITILGAMLASLAGVIAERLGTGESWGSARSKCNSCATTLGALDLIPVLSWLFAQARCRYCRAPVPYQYPLSEVVLAGLFFAGYQTLGFTWVLVPFLVALFFLMIIVLYDLRHTVVPLPLALLLFLAALTYAYLSTSDLRAFGLSLLVAGALGLLFFLLHVCSRGRAMGLGDAPVVLSLALLAGSHALPGLLFSFWIGAVIGICILVTTPKGHRMGIEVPFVPFLAAGFLLAFFTQWHPFLF